MKTKLIAAFTLLFLFFYPGKRGYAATPGQAVKDTAGPHMQPPPAKPAAPQVPELSRITTDYDGGGQRQAASEEDKPNVVYAGNYLRFTITHPLAFLNTKPTDNARVALYINGIEMTGLLSDWCRQVTRLQINSGQVTMADTAVILLRLRRNDTSQSAWNFFYSQANHRTDPFVTLDASVGWQNMSALPKAANVQKITIIYYKVLVFWAWLAVYVLILAGFLVLAIRSNALKDMTGVVTDPAAPGYDATQQGVYSLSLTQLLFWTTLVIGAFIYCLVLTDMTSSLNPSVMLLIGISAGTTGIAYVVDSNFSASNPAVPGKKHRSFIWDILSDGTSYSVQRIQVFAWNLVLGLYFIIYTIANKTMPEFSSTLLFLAGITSASYLSAKAPENNAAAAAAANPNH